MTRPKVLKPKALDIGSDLVLDTERCILCSRCVRFEEEVTKKGQLGIFDRGDRAIIGTYNNEKIDHNYQGNLVDVCPVGAFTQKSFRFKQRVWYLKENKATCAGCSTGCQISVHGKPETLRYYRIKPEESDVNGHWICDYGRKTYEHCNVEERLGTSYTWSGSSRRAVDVSQAIDDLASELSQTSADDIAVLVSAQYTCEEYDAFFAFFIKDLGIKNVFQWREPTEDASRFDGILKRGDENANTFGLLESLQKHGINKTCSDEFDLLASVKPKLTIALAPQIPSSFPSLNQQLNKLSELPKLSLWSNLFAISQMDHIQHAIPMKVFAEKKGTFKNFEGREGRLDMPFPPAIKSSRDVVEVIEQLKSTLGRF